MSREGKKWLHRQRIAQVVLVLVALSYVLSLFEMHGRLDQHVRQQQQHQPSSLGTPKPPSTPKEEKEKLHQPDGRFPPDNLSVILLDKSTMAGPSSSYKHDTSDLWESSTLPAWMKDYFSWHKEQRQRTLDGAHQPRYLIVSCLHSYRKCGGTADRLMTLPFMIKIAAVSQRVLLYQWERPATLESFLMPPVGGMDWRVPVGLSSEGIQAGGQEEILRLTVQDHSVVWVKFQSHDHGATYYDTYKTDPTEPSFREVFSAVWRMVFTPAPALATEIQDFLTEKHLVPGHYPSVHLRALYGVADRNANLLEGWARNAVNCASQLAVLDDSNDAVMYLASDSRHATLAAVVHGRKHGWNVVAASAGTTTKNPLHLDKAGPGHDVTEYYDTFVDLYAMSLGRCVAYSMGNYGLFALYMSADASCGMQHHAAVGVRECALAEPPKAETTAALSRQGEIFLPPMEPR